MEKINFVDRVPSNVATNGAIRYGIYNSDGSLREYMYIAKEDEPSVIGTKVDKRICDLIDKNTINTNGKADLSSKCWTLSNTLGYAVRTDDFIPKTWTKSSNTTYINGDFTIVGSYWEDANKQIDKGFDGIVGTYYYGYNTSQTQRTYIDLGKQYKITKLNLNMVASKPIIKGSNDLSTFTTLYDGFNLDAEGVYDSDGTETIELTTTGQYRYYAIETGKKDTSDDNIIELYEFEVAEWHESCYITTFNFDIGEIEEDTTMEVRTTATSYRNLLRFNDRDIFITNIIASNKYFELLYNGSSFDATQLT